ncbi:MAG: hypothetical protein HYW57_04335 [Ignavibacteriales bacterium]|nr:hypothetical protein [Ignavibacteriales bacterium]
MNRLKTWFSERSSRSSLLVLTGFSLVCTQIPLFNYLGFEFSVLTALVAGYVSGLYVLLQSRKTGPGVQVLELYMQTLPVALFFLLPPLAVIALNAIFIKNCSFPQGLMFYALIPLPTVLFLNSLAVFIAGATKRWRRIRYTAAYLGILLHVVVVTFATPQIFAFNPILGFFPGVTYDESLEIGWRLLIYRGTTLVAAGVLVVLGGAIQRSRQTSTNLVRAMTRWERIGGLAGLVLLVVFFVFSDNLGFSSSERLIRKELGGERTTEHFVILYPADRLSQEQSSKIADLHEFYFELLSRELRVIPNRRIVSFVYETKEQKGKLLGAAGTNIAKPWLWQLHINLGDLNATLKHELVHVMAAEFGFPLLRIGLNSGLIEGLAMAAERVEYDETLHRLAAQIFGTGLKPDMESLFSLTGFFKAHGGTSYVLAGSFCRYLIDQYGMRRFKWLYRTGSFESFYNKDLPTLLEEWRRFISELKPSPHELAKAAYLFRRPSIFGKECARVIASLNAETRESLRSGQYDNALVSSRRSLDLTGSPEAITLYATALFRLKRYDDVIRFVSVKLADSTVAHALLPLFLTLGDSYWAKGRESEARDLYEKLYLPHLSLPLDESAGMRLAALKHPASEDFREFFVGGMEDTARIDWLEARQSQGDLIQYLLGRELFGREQYEEALQVLTRVPILDSGVLEYVRFRRVARSYYELGEYQKARMFFWESLNFTSKQSHQIETEEWLERCDWMDMRGEE